MRSDLLLNWHKNIHVLQINIICYLSFVTILSREYEKWPHILHSDVIWTLNWIQNTKTSWTSPLSQCVSYRTSSQPTTYFLLTWSEAAGPRSSNLHSSHINICVSPLDILEPYAELFSKCFLLFVCLPVQNLSFRDTGTALSRSLSFQSSDNMLNV